MRLTHKIVIIIPLVIQQIIGIIRQNIKDQLLMKPLSHQSIKYCQKQNINYINRLISPQPTRNSKFDQNNAKSQRKKISLTPQAQFCQNHEYRQATHYVLKDNNKLRYCEKCAIMAASRGFPVQKLASISSHCRINTTAKSIFSNQKSFQQNNKRVLFNERKNSVNELKKNIVAGQQRLKNKYLEVQNLLIESGSRYSDLIQQVSSYFEVIEQIVQYQKYMIYNKILSERIKQQKDVRQFKEYIGNAVQQIRRINFDINQNEDVAISVCDDWFSHIMNKYKTTIEHVSDIMVVKPQIQVYNNIQFPQQFQNELNQLVNLIQFKNQKTISIIQQQQYPQQNQQYNLALESLSHQSYSNNVVKSVSIDSSQQNDIYKNQNYVYEQQNQQSFIEHNSSQISEHSFSNKSAFMQKNSYLNCNIDNYCSKQLKLQGDFSIGSSIADNDVQSYQQCEDNASNRNQRNTINFIKEKYIQHKINPIDESLGQYFITQQTLMNQTQQKSETFLLNQ